MTELLVKCFVKNSYDIDRQDVRTSYGVLSSVVGVISNIILFLTKLLIGILINSISVTADAFNNLSDAASGIISFVGVKLANRPADKEHPFGHGRYEYIAALIVAFLVFQVGFSCLKSSIIKIAHPEDLKFNPVLIGVLVASVLLKLWLAFFNRKLGKRINSTVMRATSADAFGDVMITTVTIVSVFITFLFNVNVDGYMGVLVSLLIFYAGIGILKDTLEPLLGEATSPDLYKKISDFVEGYEGVSGTHDLMVHNYGPSKTIATIHAEVSNIAVIEEIHEVIDQIERDAYIQLNLLLVIHMDPIEVDDERVVNLRKSISDLVREMEAKASIHDFRIVNGKEQINLIFDLVLPFECSKAQIENMLAETNKRLKEKDSRYQCVITVDHSHIANTDNK